MGTSKPAGRRIGRKATPTPEAPGEAWRGPRAHLRLLRALTLTPAVTPRVLGVDALRTATLEPAEVPALSEALAAFDDPREDQARALALICDHLQPERFRALPRVQQQEALARRARDHHQHGRLSEAANDWAASSFLSPDTVPAAVIPWVALNRIRAGDAGPSCLRFYRDHAEEIDRVIQERPRLDRDGLVRALNQACLVDGNDDDAIGLARRMLQLSKSRGAWDLTLAQRLFHSGELDEAADLLDRAEAHAETLPATHRRDHLARLHLYRGALHMQRRALGDARRALRQARALEPRGLAGALLAAEVEAQLGSPGDRLLRRKALLLLDRVEGAADAHAPPAWLPKALRQRCTHLRETLAVEGP